MKIKTLIENIQISLDYLSEMDEANLIDFSSFFEEFDEKLDEIIEKLAD